MIPITSGVVELFGFDIKTHIDKVREHMGVCPQHDVLFEQLTVAEHLDIFCDFKGVPRILKKQTIRDMLLEVDLMKEKNTLAKNLSGGNRRKLSVAIALIGDSKFVLLDEPTAGMDLTARRKLWDMLKRQKQNRIILLTTHYMDEADLLGDRIGIMSQGELVCLGSSLFLKKKYGVGYNLTVVKRVREECPSILKYLRE